MSDENTEFGTTMMKQMSPEVESCNNHPDTFDKQGSVFETSMNRVCIHQSIMEDSRNVNSGIAVNTLQKNIILCLHIAHLTALLQFRQSIFLK